MGKICKKCGKPPSVENLFRCDRDGCHGEFIEEPVAPIPLSDESLLKIARQLDIREVAKRIEWSDEDIGRVSRKIYSDDIARKILTSPIFIVIFILSVLLFIGAGYYSLNKDITKKRLCGRICGSKWHIPRAGRRVRYAVATGGDAS